MFSPAVTPVTGEASETDRLIMAQKDLHKRETSDRASRNQDAPVPSGYVLYCPTLRCNFNCIQCTIADRDSARHELAVAEILSVFTKSSVLKSLPVQISGGEPFLRKDIHDILLGLLALGHPLQIFTNGYFPEKVRAFLDAAGPGAPLSFSISIDGLEDTHNRIRKHARSFSRALETIMLVKGKGIRVQADCTIMPENIGELGALREFFNSRNIAVLFMPLNTFPDDHKRYEIRSVYDEAEIPQILPYLNVFPTDIPYVIRKKRTTIKDCHAGFTSCYIDPEGMVAACAIGRDYFATDLFNLGNLRDFHLDFDRLWQSGGARRARKKVKTCPGCYNPCEIMREVYCHGFMETVSLEEISRYLTIPSRIQVSQQECRPFFPGALIQPPGDFCWIEDTQDVYIHVKEEHDMLCLTLAARYPPERKDPLHVEIALAEGDVLDAMTIEQGFWRDVMCPIPDRVRGKDATFRISVKEAPSRRPRQAGLALAGVRGIRSEQAEEDARESSQVRQKSVTGFHLFKDAFLEELKLFPLSSAYIKAYLEKIPLRGRLTKLSEYQQLAQKFGPGFWEKTEREMALMLEITGYGPEIYREQLDFLEKLSGNKDTFEEIVSDIYEDSLYPLTEHLFNTIFAVGVEKIHETLELAAELNPSPARFLDLGFGPGVLSALVAEEQSRWTGSGVDISRQCYHYASRLLRLKGLESRVDLRLGDIRSLVFDPHSFDYIFALEVMEHVPDPDRILAECRRVLKPGGRMICCLPVQMPLAMHLSVFDSPDQIKRFYHDAGWAILAFTERISGGIRDTMALLTVE